MSVYGQLVDAVERMKPYDSIAQMRDFLTLLKSAEDLNDSTCLKFLGDMLYAMTSDEWITNELARMGRELFALQEFKRVLTSVE